MEGTPLADRLRELEREYDGEFSVCSVHLASGAEFRLRDDRILPTASVFKLCVLCELLRQAGEGVVDLDRPITWKPEFTRTGDGVLRAMAPGQELSVRNMAVLMMVVSDNIATATLVDLVGARSVTRTMQAWGLTHTDIHDGLPPPGVSGVVDPVSSATDLCGLAARIFRREILTPSDCDEILRIMRANRGNDMLPRYIPVGEDWGKAEEWIASKPGYGACRVEVGIVRLKTFAFALGMFFKPGKVVGSGLKCLADYPPVLAMAKAAHAVYEHWRG